jgi:predicted small lipoprotein YifL
MRPALSAGGLAGLDGIRSTWIVKRMSLSIVVLLFALAGCGSKSENPPANAGGSSGSATGSASSTAKPSTTPSATPGTLKEFSVDGAGPYQLGLTLTTLQAKPGLDEVTTGTQACPDNTFARGTGDYRDVRLSFRKDGKLYLALNRSDAIPTPSGAWLGTTLADLKKIYGGLQGQDLTRGANSAFLIQTLSGGGILFELDAGKKVVSMAAADAAYLRNAYTAGTEYC